MKVQRKDDGSWEYKTKPKATNNIYSDTIIYYLNAFDALFEKAKQACEFEFILTLLRVRGLQDAGWDPFENTQEAFSCISKIKGKVRDFKTSRHLFLWLYGHIVEASEPYEILANLINISSGDRFRMSNFPDKPRGRYSIPQSPSEKIQKLEETASLISMERTVFPLTDAFDRDLRNAIFHADYSLYVGEVRIKKPVKSYSNEEITTILNKGLAYFQAFVSMFNSYIHSYDEPKIIPVHPEFATRPNHKAITIIREGYGLIGMQDYFENEQDRIGESPFRLGHFLDYETELLKRQPTLCVMPRNKIERINKTLRLLPKFLSSRIVKRLRKNLL